MSYASRIAAFFNFAIGAARRAVRLDGDVVFATSTPLTIALPAVYAARRKRVPMIFEVRDLWPELPIAMGALKSPLSRCAARVLERFSYANAARVVALSPGMAAGIARTGYEQGRIVVVPNGADLDFFHRDPARGQTFRRKLGIADDKIVVGYTGTLGRINGTGYLVRIAAALKQDSRFVFLMVGDGFERKQVEAFAREQDVLDRNFLLLPMCPKADMPDVLSAIDIATSLFLPIRAMEANSANKFFDALAAGCCIAINYGGWQAQLLREADAGIQLSADAREAGAQLQALAEDPDGISASGRNARRLAEERFSRDELAAQLEAVIIQVAAEAKQSGSRLAGKAL